MCITYRNTCRVRALDVTSALLPGSQSAGPTIGTHVCVYIYIYIYILYAYINDNNNNDDDDDNNTNDHIE